MVLKKIFLALAIWSMMAAPAYAMTLKPMVEDVSSKVSDKGKVTLTIKVKVVVSGDNVDHNITIYRTPLGGDNKPTGKQEKRGEISCPKVILEGPLDSERATTTFTESPGNGKYRYTVKTDDGSSRSTDVTVTNHLPGADDEDTKGGITSLHFTNKWLSVVMLWYCTLVMLSGAFIFLVIVRSGYRYYHSSIDPSIRASLLMDIQRCFVAMLIIILAPYCIYLLIQINDAGVSLFRNMTKNIIDSTNLELQQKNLDGAGMFETIVAAPFQTIVAIFNDVFDLYSLDQLIFNDTAQSPFFGDIFGQIQVGNVFATALLNMCFIGFNAYFNALYEIRFWVVSAAFVGTPLIVWIWALTEERQVLELWGGEIISTIFMQFFHALVFGVFFTILVASRVEHSATFMVNTLLAVASVDELALTLRKVGVWFASLGGALCFGTLLSVAIKMAVSRGDERKITEAKESFSKAITGVFVLGLSLIIAGFLVWLFSGDWY
ncbi:pilin [Desulforamulus ruminis]|uniref:pilin n=1 Tax=Desulforamulus ruminis TaxID=1564 RepID=UPI0023553E5A|nr:pilin [Desulforamulus ruminis]